MEVTARLNSMAQVELEGLRAEGFKPTDKQIVEINDLAWEVFNPTNRMLLSRGRPVCVGGKWLWPLTIHSIQWLEDNGYNGSMVSPAVGYAMCYGNSEGKELLCSGLKAKIKIAIWFNSLVATYQEFEQAVIQVDEQDACFELPVDVDNKPISLGDLSTMLTTLVGGTPEMWERRVSSSYARDCLSTYIIQNRADGLPSDSDPRLIAERALGYALEKIRNPKLVKKHREEALKAGA